MPTGNSVPGPTWDVGLYSTFSEISKRHVSIDRFMRELCTIRRSDLVEWAGTLLQIVSEPYGQNLRTQQELIDLCLDAGLAKSASQILAREGRNVIFHRRQLWLLLQFACIVCGEDGIPITCLRSAFGRLCLIASDCLHSIQLAHVSTDVAEKERLEWQVALLISISEIMPDANCLARAHSLWFDSIADPAVQKQHAHCGVHDGLETVFTTHYGISLSETFFALVTIYKYLTARTRARPITPIVMTVEGDWWGAVSSDTRSRVLNMLSVRIDEFPAHLFGTPRQSWATDFSSLMARPLIESKSGHFICPDISYLRTFFVDGIFWLVDKALPDKEWGNAFGAIYEWYVKQVISASMHRRRETRRMLIENVKFKGTTDEVCDALILNENTAAICEAKGTRLTTRQKSGVNVEETIDAIRKSVASGKSGIGQLAKNIAKILRGDIVVAGDVELDVAARNDIIPVLVWYEESACNWKTRIFLDNVLVDLLTAKGIDPSRVGPLLLLSTHDLELFEQCSHYIPADELLTQFADFVREHPEDVRCEFLRYAYSFFKGQEQPRGFIGDKVDRLFESIKAEHVRRSQADSGNP